jgi:hypothetical protein
MLEMSETINAAIPCPYCNVFPVLVSGKAVYPAPRFKDLWKKNFWMCKKCDARVGCHPGTTRALGRLANKELRDLKMKAHKAFDPLWFEYGGMSRTVAYSWLSKELGIDCSFCHIGMFDEDTCRKVIEVCEAWQAKRKSRAEMKKKTK